ncbi:hypothetical protein V1502_09285 [Bacillus sp. SCS-153A]|uniref:hypothetical protein n=1 Tax=Rossellomorea sedimentorum TaxID=3115294 RepID=UPI003905D23B
MNKQVSNTDIDDLLKRLEDDYIKALDSNECSTVEGFIQQFLDDSWEYNQSNIDMITSVMSRYTKGELKKTTFSESFSRMVNHLQKKLSKLDADKEYPLIHSDLGASVLVSFVDGLVIQYYIGVYSAGDLKKLSSQLKQVVLNALKTPIMD